MQNPGRCLKCTGPLPGSKNGQPRKFCSKKCVDRYHYEQARADGRYDSRVDKEKRLRAQERASRPTSPCPFCGKLIAHHHGQPRKACSAIDCVKKLNVQRQVARERRLRAEYAARGESYRAQWGWKSYGSHRLQVILDGDAIDRDKLGERDGWICGLCSEPIDPACKYPDPLSASIDHVIPLGPKFRGTHTWDNVQIAHNRCNVTKKDRIDWSPEPIWTASPSLTTTS